MRKSEVAFAVALSGLLLAACGSRSSTAAQDNEGAAASNAVEDASPSGPALPNASDSPGTDPVPPPDAVSHPDGYLPNASDLPPPADTDNPAGAKDPPATEDEYLRNRQ